MIKENNIKNTRPRQKALGQYFTGLPLAKLLASLADGRKTPVSIIDPMCGSGDMLFASWLVYGEKPELVGIDIDTLAIAESRHRLNSLPLVTLISGNAFDVNTWNKIGLRQYDLVITNPPYVRYQSMTEEALKNGLPTAVQVRQGLLSIVEVLPDLNKEDKGIFINLINGYSGLADLAVPSWILCAVLTKMGGKLAMVVPEAWLSRDYASPIHWMLMKFFKPLYIIEDASHSWFDQAQIKTTLVIAERVNGIKDPAKDWQGNNLIFASLDNSGGAESLVERYYGATKNPDFQFASDMESLLIKGKSFSERVPFRHEFRDISKEAQNSVNRIKRTKRLYKLLKSKLPITINETKRFYIPPQINNLIDSNLSCLTTLDSMGLGIGQGLRTGANNFFYTDILEEDEFSETVIVRTSQQLGGQSIIVPKPEALPVIRYQSELPYPQRVINIKDISGRVLFLEGSSLPEDMESLSEQLFHIENKYKITTSLLDYIRLAATTPARVGDPKLIPDMSAVKTNTSETQNRRWYWLPKLTARHLPDVLIPRVNNQIPQAWVVLDHKVIVDANFSTIWFLKETTLDIWSLFALLNSTWAQTVMELSGTVLGGGALKLEASHLRQIPIPILEPSQVKEISSLGKLIAYGDFDVINKVDRIILSSLTTVNSIDGLIDELARLRDKHFNNRKFSRKNK